VLLQFLRVGWFLGVCKVGTRHLGPITLGRIIINDVI